MRYIIICLQCMNRTKQVRQVAAKLPFFDFGGGKKDSYKSEVGPGYESSTWAWLPGMHILAHLSSDIAHQVLSLLLQRTLPAWRVMFLQMSSSFCISSYGWCYPCALPLRWLPILACWCLYALLIDQRFRRSAGPAAGPPDGPWRSNMEGISKQSLVYALALQSLLTAGVHFMFSSILMAVFRHVYFFRIPGERTCSKRYELTQTPYPPPHVDGNHPQGRFCVFLRAIPLTPHWRKPLATNAIKSTAKSCWCHHITSPDGAVPTFVPKLMGIWY